MAIIIESFILGAMTTGLFTWLSHDGRFYNLVRQHFKKKAKDQQEPEAKRVPMGFAGKSKD